MLNKNVLLTEMHRASPYSYQGLLFIDYPTKNSAQVSALARRNLTSDEVKEQIANQVNELLKPDIESKTADMNPMVHAAVYKAIETAVNRPMNAIVLDDNNILLKTTSDSR